MSKQPLEQTIKEYFDQYGAILLGMHQDLQSQQATVDRKLAEAGARTAASLATFNDKADGIVSRVLEDADRVASILSSLEQARAEHLASLDVLTTTALQSIETAHQRAQSNAQALVSNAEAQLARSVGEFDQRTAAVVTQVVSSTDALTAMIHQGETDHQQRLVLLNAQVDAAVTTAKGHVDALKKVAREQIEVFEADLASAGETFAQAIANTSKSFTDHVRESRNTLAAEIEKVRGRIQEAVERHQRMVDTALDEYRATNTAQQKWFEEHSALLSAQATETIARLQEIDEKTAAHQRREVAFNKRMRQLAVGILVVSAIAVLAVVMVWKP